MNLFKNLNLRKKFFLNYGVILALFILVGVGSLNIINFVHNNDKKAISNWEQANFITEKEVDHLTWIKDLNESIIMNNDFTGELNPQKCSFGQTYYEIKDSSEYENYPQKIKNTIDRIEEPHKKLHTSAEEIVNILNDPNLSQKARREKAISHYQNYTLQYLEKVQSRFDEYKNYLKDQANQKAQLSKEKIATSRFYTYVAMGIIIVIIISFLIGFIKDTINPLKKAVNFSSDIAEGNLQIEDMEVNRKDEVGSLVDALNIMKNNLQEVIENISKTSRQINLSSGELSAAGDQIGASAEQVNTAIQEVASGAEEQSAQIDESSDKINGLINNIQDISQLTDELANDGNAVMESIEEGIDYLSKSIKQVKQTKNETERVSATIKNMGEMSKEIADVTDLINGLSEQTNLLALNAAIEAARAGSAGRGFSVLADEIRELAEESTRATDKIADLNYKIQNNIKEAINSMDRNTEVVLKSVDSIQETKTAFDSINSLAKKLKNSLKRITSKSKKMNNNSNEVKDIIHEIGSVSQEAASNAEEVAASSEEQTAATEEVVNATKELAGMADKLNDMMEEFNF